MSAPWNSTKPSPDNRLLAVLIYATESQKISTP